MAVSLVWHKALSALKWSPSTKTAQAGWPETFSINEVSRLQYPNDAKSQRTLANALLADIETGALKAIYYETEPSGVIDVVVVINLSSPFYVQPLPLIDWLNINGETPGEHIKNWFEQARAVGDDGADNQDGAKRIHRELTKWLKETWLIENKPDGTAFFNALKKHLNKPGSPIVEHYTTGKKGAGIRWNTGNATNYMTKKAIQNAVSKFKLTP